MSLIAAIRYGIVGDATKMLEDGNADIYETSECGYTPLIYACRNGQEKIVKLLLDRDDSFEYINKQNIYGNTALIVASVNGHKGIVELLLDRCDLRSRNEYVNHGNRIGYTALICASTHGRKEIVKLLLTNDAFIDHQSNRELTAIDLACSYCSDPDGVRKEEIRNLLLNYEPKNTKRAKGSL